MPLRFPHRVTALLAVGLAAAWLALGSMPGQADQVRQQEWWLSKVGVTPSWRTSQGAGATVAVVGDGVAPGQPDLAGSVQTARDFSHSGRASGGPLYGLNGTAVASIIAGHGHGPGQSAGIIGVAPQARILAVRATLSTGDPLLSDPAAAGWQPSAIALAVRYAVRHGASVIDLPLDPAQSEAGRPGSAAPAGIAAESAAIGYALSRQVVLVAPAGDNGAGSDAVNYPAAFPGVISVGAFDQNFAKAAFSSRQPYVTLTAPGSGIIAAAASGGYATISSTSAASAVVAGIAALIRARFPELAVAQVTSALTSSTVFGRSGGTSAGSGHGTVNAATALVAAARIAAPLARPAAAGALPLASPAPPAFRTSSPGLARTLLRDGVISAGVLIILLLPIAAYGMRRRRRDRQDAAASVAWHRPGPPGHPPGPPPGRSGRAGGPGAAARPSDADRALDLLPAPTSTPGMSDADRMLELFSAPAGTAGWPPDAGAMAGVRPPHGHSGVTVVRHAQATDANDGSGSPGGETAAGGGRRADGDEAAAASGGGSAPRPVLSAASRATGRPPKISGSPPWGPAPKPDSQLPWETAPPPQVISGRSAASAATLSAAGAVWSGASVPPAASGASPAPAAAAPQRPSGPLWPAAPAPSPAPSGPWPAAGLPRPPAPPWPAAGTRSAPSGPPASGVQPSRTQRALSPPSGAQPSPSGAQATGAEAPPYGAQATGAEAPPSGAQAPPPGTQPPPSGPLWPPASAPAPPTAVPPGATPPRAPGPLWPTAPAAPPAAASGPPYGGSIWDAADRGQPQRRPGQGGEAARRPDHGGPAAPDPGASTETLPAVPREDG